MKAIYKETVECTSAVSVMLIEVTRISFINRMAYGPPSSGSCCADMGIPVGLVDIGDPRALNLQADSCLLAVVSELG